MTVSGKENGYTEFEHTCINNSKREKENGRISSPVAINYNRGYYGYLSGLG